jgi:hypothetical protein
MGNVEETGKNTGQPMPDVRHQASNAAEARERKRRRTHQKRRHRRLDRAFSPEADRFWYHFKIILVLVPTVAFVTGAIVWFGAIWKKDASQYNQAMIWQGKLMIAMGFCGLILLYIWSLRKAIKDMIYDWVHPKQKSDLNWEHNHRRRRRSTRRRHRSDYRQSSSGFKAE